MTMIATSTVAIVVVVDEIRVMVVEVVSTIADGVVVESSIIRRGIKP
jgi:hypothetical protein